MKWKRSVKESSVYCSNGQTVGISNALTLNKETFQCLTIRNTKKVHRKLIDLKFEDSLSLDENGLMKGLTKMVNMRIVITYSHGHSV